MYKANMTERRLGVKDFSYTDDLLDELEASLSRERLGTYLDAAGGDREGAIRLHAWNTAVSAVNERLKLTRFWHLKVTRL